MPTARELLEQADALMRRNRTTGMDDIPVLTDSVDVPVMRRRPPPAASTRDPIPTLTDSVSKSLEDTQDSLVPEGEPSDWLDLDGGEPSITGDAPDSIAIVPPVGWESQDDEELLESAEHEEIELTTPEESVADDAVVAAPEDEPRAPEPIPADAESEPEIAPEEIDVVELEATEVAPERAVEETPEPVAEVLPVSPPVVEAEPEAEAEPEPEPEAPVPSTEDVEAFAALGQVQIDAADPMPPVHAESAAIVAAAAPPPPAPVVDDQARWDMMAEEIRSQVLQRIDLFTDTGLREQLGRRLQPIVDRASADLVTTINTHVGELLRAYVAEAIEREIENWRRDH